MIYFPDHLLYVNYSSFLGACDDFSWPYIVTYCGSSQRNHCTRSAKASSEWWIFQLDHCMFCGTLSNPGGIWAFLLLWIMHLVNVYWILTCLSWYYVCIFARDTRLRMADYVIYLYLLCRPNIRIKHSWNQLMKSTAQIRVICQSRPQEIPAKCSILEWNSNSVWQLFSVNSHHLLCRSLHKPSGIW